jgi:hypothetical protein
MRGDGVGCGVSANEYICAHHETWPYPPKKNPLNLRVGKYDVEKENLCV